MIKAILISIIFVLNLQGLQAQEVETEATAQKKVSISGAYIMWGNRDSDHRTTLNNNVLGSLSGGVVEVNTGTFYSGNMGAHQSPMRVFMGGLTIDVNTKAKSKYLHQFRAGFTYNHQNVYGYASNGTSKLLNRTYIDTIVSSATGNILPIYRDSIYRTLTSATYTNRYATLDFSYIFRLHPEKMISFYTGIGIGLGLVFNATTKVEDYNYIEVVQNMYFPNIYAPQNQTNYNSSERIIRNSPGLGLDVFVPLGISVRLGKEADVWKNVSLFAELRPTMSIQHTKDTGSNTQSGAIRLFGIRAHF
jgi:hypothetical protein